MNGGEALTVLPAIFHTLSLKSWDLADLVPIKFWIINRLGIFTLISVLTFNYLRPVRGNLTFYFYLKDIV